MQDANASQAALISHLNQEINNSKITIQNLQLRVSMKPKKPRVDIQEIERANKAASTIDQLEKLLS